jgi:hypothetical protein
MIWLLRKDYTIFIDSAGPAGTLTAIRNANATRNWSIGTFGDPLCGTVITPS